jgi:hypothetical protein
LGADRLHLHLDSNLPQHLIAKKPSKIEVGKATIAIAIEKLTSMSTADFLIIATGTPSG